MGIIGSYVMWTLPLNSDNIKTRKRLHSGCAVIQELGGQQMPAPVNFPLPCPRADGRRDVHAGRVC